jgi:hypothetical protein
MPTFYNFRENGLDYSFDDIFVPADWFRDGGLWTWGYGNSGQLGDSTLNLNILTPITTFSGGINWKQLSAGYRFTVAIKTDGTLWTWGNGANGRLGNAVTTNVSTPVTTFAGGNNWKQVSAGKLQIAAIKTDGTLWTWGNASNGALGNSVTTGIVSTPVTTFAGGTNWKQVSVGGNNLASIKTDGTLWTWGPSAAGQLGNANTDLRSTPVTTFLGGTNWKQVSAGDAHMSAIKTDGTLWTWGAVSSGRLGNAVTTGNRSTPVTTFLGGTNWKQVSCGYVHTAAIKTDGTLWIWGNGLTGRLGNGITTGNRSTPVTTFLGGTNWKQVSCGSGGSFADHTAAIKTDGTLWTWGLGGNGRLGNNATTDRSTPVTTFSGGTNWKQVSSGDSHTTALTYIDPVI